MLGVFKLYKNQIANEMKINRHLAPKNESEILDDAEISTTTIDSKLTGLKRSSWITLTFLAASTICLFWVDFWMQRTMFGILDILFIISIYTNSHNIENHHRWMNEIELLNKSEYADIFLKHPLRYLKQAFFKQGAGT